MNTGGGSDGVHVELTVEGLGREAFARALGWVWEQVDVLFPIITGQWNFTEAIIPTGILAGLMFLSRLIVHVADGGNSAQIPRALVADPHDPKLATWRSHNQYQQMLERRSSIYAPALKPLPENPPPAPVRQRLKFVDYPAMLAHDLFDVLARFYVKYLGLSVLVCLIFGLGDLGIPFTVVGIGGGS